jgi:WD40 repeat protein/serine/threonine protein kinase
VPEPERDARLIFYEILEQQPADQTAFLDEVCGGDSQLRSEVEDLLSTLENPDAFFEEPFARHREFGTDDLESDTLLITLRKMRSPSFPRQQPEARARDPDSLDMDSESAGAERLVELPGYQVLRELGRGGMGVVYLARQLSANRLVALKVILSQSQVSVQEQARFRTEAGVIATLQHPGIVQIFEVGEHEGNLYFSLEFCSAGSLDRYLAGTPLKPGEAARLTLALSQAIAVAHAARIIHRDLKPANVLLAPALNTGAPRAEERKTDEARLPLNAFVLKVTDFGLAKKLDDVGHTKTGQILGSPSYMAPEQARGEKVGTAADIYALGAILYECLTGRPPFKAASSWETILQVTRESPVSPRQVQPGLPRDLETICLKCLHKEAPRRYASAGDLADDLQRYLEGRPIRARPVGILERGLLWCQRNPLSAILISAVVLVLVLGIITTSIALGFALDFAQTAEENRRQAEANADEAVRQGQEARALAGRLREELNQRNELLFSAQLARARAIMAHEPMQALHLLHNYDRCPIAMRNTAWNLLERQCRRECGTLIGHTGAVLAVACSPDGKTIASAGEDGSVKLWDIGTSELVASLGKKSYPIRTLAFDPKGDVLVAAGGRIADRRGEIVWWDIDARCPRHVSKPEIGPVHALAFTRDGSALASLGARVDKARAQWVSEVLLWDGRQATVKPMPRGAFGSGKPVQPIIAPPRQSPRPLTPDERTTSFTVESICFDPTGKWLATTQNGRATIWDTVTGEQSVQVSNPRNWAISVSFSPKGKLLASSYRNGLILLTDARTGKEQGKMETTRWARPVVSFSPDGLSLAATDGSRIRIWDVQSKQLRLVLEQHTEKVSSLCYSPDGRMLISSCGQLEPGRKVINREVKLWKMEPDGTASARTQRCRLSRVIAAGAARTKPLLAICGWLSDSECVLRLWDPLTEKSLGDIGGDMRNVKVLAFSPNGDLLAVRATDSVSLWDVASRTRITSWRARGQTLLAGEPGDGATLRFSADGTRLAAAHGDSISLWDVQTTKLLWTFPGDIGMILSIDMSRDGTLLAAAGKGIQIWDVRSGKPFALLPASLSQCSSVEFSPDGSKLAAAELAGQFVLWDVCAKKVITRRKVSLRSISFSPDGKSLAGYQPSGKVAILAPTAGQVDVVLELAGKQHGLRLLRFLEGGDRLCLVEAIGKVSVWNTSAPRIHAYLEHNTYLVSIAFSSDGKVLQGKDKVGKVIDWDVATGLLRDSAARRTFQEGGEQCFTDDFFAEIDYNTVRVMRR